MGECLDQFAGGDFSCRQHDRAPNSSARGVSRSRCRRVSGRSANQCARAAIDCARNRHRHSTVLERSGRVYAFVLNEHFATAPDARAQLWRKNKRRVPLAQRDDGLAGRKKFAKSLDNASPARTSPARNAAHSVAGGPALVHVPRFHRQCVIRIQLGRLSSRNWRL